MKLHPLHRFLISTFLILVSFEMFGQKKISASFYNDTIFEFNGCTIELKNTYIRKKLFLRTTVKITNRTDKFMLIDPDDVFLISLARGETKSMYKKTIVIPPNYSNKFELKFNDVGFDTPLLVYNFSKIRFTSHANLVYVISDLHLGRGYHSKLGKLDVEMIDVKVTDEVYKVRIRVNYDGSDFLAINFNNIGINSPMGKCYNLKKLPGKFHFNPNHKTEVINLAFSINCASFHSHDKLLTFGNVFTSYAIEITDGFKISQRLVVEELSENMKTDKPDIELIE